MASADARAAAALFQARLKPGTRVQARYDDGSGKLQWYDAVVVVGSATNGSDVRVRWMGYGTVDAVSAASVRPPPPLPAGWLESTDDESGFPYYENATTGETTWARPRGGRCHEISHMISVLVRTTTPRRRLWYDDWPARRPAN